MSLFNPFPLKGPGGSPNRLDVTSEIRLQKAVTSVLITLAHSGGSLLPSCKLPYGAAFETRNRGRSSANRQEASEKSSLRKILLEIEERGSTSCGGRKFTNIFSNVESRKWA